MTERIALSEKQNREDGFVLPWTFKAGTIIDIRLPNGEVCRCVVVRPGEES